MFKVSRKLAACNLSTSASLWSGHQSKVLRKNKLQGKQVNRFNRDKGVSRQLENLGLDRMDDALHPELIRSDADLESMRDESRLFRKQFKADHNPERVKQILINKKIFPHQKKPNLLTAVEKETIRYLHQKDPHEWTIERLTESFPVDRFGVKKILKNSGPKSLQSLHRLDKQAADNWKKLNEGTLEIDKDLKQHLKQFPRKHIHLGETETDEIYQQIEERFHGTKPKMITEPGEFSRILEDYERKTGKLDSAPEDRGQRLQGQGEQIDLGEMANLFGPNTVPDTPMIGESSPYGDTALLRTSINLRSEPGMDIEMFRENYLSPTTQSTKETATLLPFKDEDSGNSSAKEAFDQWLHMQNIKTAAVSKFVKQVDVKEVLAEHHQTSIDSVTDQPERRKYKEADNNHIREGSEQLEIRQDRSSITNRDEVYVFSESRGASKVLVEGSPDQIDIPEQLKNRHDFFQYGDSVYDSEGEFLYRVPRLNEE